MLIEEHIRQGYSLLEATEQTKHLRARDTDERDGAASPAAPAPPPPDMAALADLQRWNTVR